MYCPECKSENSDSAKFCKKCGKPLKGSSISHEKMINEISKEKSGSNDTTKYIIIALIVVAIALAGVFAFVGFGNHTDDSQSSPQQAANTNQEVKNDDNQPAQATQTSQPAKTISGMEILGGSFSTGSGLEDKTYASIYVGPQHSGENVKIQIWYSRDGSTLNNGNMVPKTVDSSGYIEVASAEPYKYYPDFAEINLYDTSGNLLDTQSVSLNPDSGTQSF